MDWKLIVGVISSIMTAVIVWFLNERQKRADKISSEKEKRYEGLITHMKYFGKQFELKDIDNELSNQFILQLQLSWMYCSDEVIKKAHDLLKEMEMQLKCGETNQQTIDRLKGEFIFAIRRDLLSSKKIFKRRDRSIKLEPSHFLDIHFSHNLNEITFSAFVREKETPRVIIDNRPRLENHMGIKGIPTGFNSLDEMYDFFKISNIVIDRIGSESGNEGTEHKFKIIYRRVVAPKGGEI